MAERSELQENRLKSVDNAISQIQRQFGKGAIMRLGSDERENIPVIPTGILSIDLALGVGGLPRGRVTEIYGPESSGKTTLALHVIAEAQRRGGNVAFIDAVVELIERHEAGDDKPATITLNLSTRWGATA